MLGSRLRKARERANLMQKDAAHKVGISNVTLSQYEKGIRNPDPHLLAKLADLYDVSADWLLGRTDDPNSNIVKGEKTYETLAQRLTDLRKKLNLTQEDMAHKLGINRDIYANYESGRREPSYEVLKKIAEYFNVSTDYLLGVADDPVGDVADTEDNRKRTDIKKLLEEEKAHWGGRELTDEERKLIQRIIQAAIEREESATYND
jgi:transcriptional regulator with XRE-family HTH domain